MNIARFASHRPILPILRRAVADAPERTVRSDELRNALDNLRRCLKPDADVRPLDWFWRAAAEPNPNVRKLWLATLLALIEGWFPQEVLPIAAQEHAA